MPDLFDDVRRSLTNQTPTPNQIEQIERLRGSALTLAAYIVASPPSRERSLAITNLEQAVMWAVKGIVLG